MSWTPKLWMRGSSSEMTDPRFAPPEPNAGSGEPSSPVAGSASRPAPAEDGSPEVRPNAPTTSRPDTEAQEPEADAVDVAGLAAKAEKADEYLELAQRTRAEFENYRRRAVKEAAAAQERGAAKLALELLPAIDNLDRALAHAGDGANGDASLISGIRHVHDDVLAALKRAGIEPYSPEGEPFDPQVHEAVAQQPFQGFEPGTVVEVYQRGYRIGDMILRPARVVVAG
jgi:molecular chaperone GrpE